MQEINNQVEASLLDNQHSSVEEASCSTSNKPQRVQVLSAATCNTSSERVDVENHNNVLATSANNLCVTNRRDSHVEYEDDNVKVSRFDNGDIQSVLRNGLINYIYHSTGTNHIIFPNGLEVLIFNK